MKDLSIDIVKDNKYYLKSPFKGKVLIFDVKHDDFVRKGQVLGVLKTQNSYVDIEADFTGVVESINVKANSRVEKWENLMVINITKQKILDDYSGVATSINSPDYDVIYTFQQETFPNFLYNDTGKLIKGIAHEKEKFIYYLFKKFFETRDMNFPFAADDFSISEELINNKIILIEINWPKLKASLLTIRSYILIDSDIQKIAYFVCEKDLDDKLKISSIMYEDNELIRTGYGEVPHDLDFEKEKVIRTFIGFLNPKKKLID